MRRLAAALALALLGGCAGGGAYFSDAGAPPAVPARALADWPWQEIWTGVVFRGQKVGFSRLELRALADAPDLWEIETESALRLRFLGTDKRVRLRALDRVRADLTLQRFDYEYHLDGSRLRVEGERDGEVLVVRTESAGSRQVQRLAMAQPALPASALALLPALRGLQVGRDLRATVFVGESQSLAEASQRVLAYERSPLFEGAAFRVATELLGLQTETWYDHRARPLLETALHGAMISALEDAATAHAYLVEASLAKDESLLDFSLLRSAPVADARRVAALSIALEGVPATLAVPRAAGQRCTRAGARLECRVDRRTRDGTADARDVARYLRPTLAVPSNERAFVELAQSVAAGASTAQEKIGRLLAWIDAHIAKAALDAFSAADVLRERRAECQGHAYLLAAFARSLGIPARIVNGIAYSEAHRGFLYHTWNELWIAGRGWRPVDATFGQAHADATHLKLIEGEAAADLMPLVGLIGKIRVLSAAPLARW